VKKVHFATIFSIALLLYSLANFYIFIRGWQAIGPHTVVRVPYLVMYVIVALAFIGGRVLERYMPDTVSNVLIWIGSVWLAATLYLFLLVLLVDLVRLSNAIVHWYPPFVTDNYPRARQIAGLMVAGIALVILVAARVNAMFPRVHTLDLTIPKVVEGPKTLHIAMASDIHLGNMVGRTRLANIVGLIDSLKPDLVILAGDIVDEDLGAVIRENLGETLKEIKAPLGVYAITGNHEYIGGVERACAYLEAHGVTMLRDSVVKINGSVYLVGREDRSSLHHGGKGRKPLAQLMAQVDMKLPVILLDHQPFDLEQSDSAGVDLQLSGHTHDGQLWPISLITRSIYEVCKGYKRIGHMQIYVSTGAGTWGPPMRLGNRPEVVDLRLTFE
jgi:predicted MPP superfamily phosphohydrolase